MEYKVSRRKTEERKGVRKRVNDVTNTSGRGYKKSIKICYCIPNLQKLVHQTPLCGAGTC